MPAISFQVVKILYSKIGCFNFAHLLKILDRAIAPAPYGLDRVTTAQTLQIPTVNQLQLYFSTHEQPETGFLRQFSVFAESSSKKPGFFGLMRNS